MIKLFENFSNEKVTLVYHFSEIVNYNLTLLFIGNKLVYNSIDIDTMHITDILDILSCFFDYEEIYLDNDMYSKLENMIHKEPKLSDIRTKIEGNKMGLM